MKKLSFFIVIVLLLQLLFPIQLFAKAPAILDYVRSTDIVAYINGYEVPSYNIKGYTAIITDDLRFYGFQLVWNGTNLTSSLTLNPNRNITPLPIQKKTEKIGKSVLPVYSSEIQTFVNGKKVESFNIGGKMAIYFKDLGVFGQQQYDNATRSTTLTVANLPKKEKITIENHDRLAIDAILRGIQNQESTISIWEYQIPWDELDSFRELWEEEFEKLQRTNPSYYYVKQPLSTVRGVSYGNDPTYFNEVDVEYYFTKAEKEKFETLYTSEEIALLFDCYPVYWEDNFDFFSSVLRENVTALQKEINATLSLLTEDRSVVEKILLVHDSMLLRYQYDTTYSNYEISDLLLTKTGVCQAYAETFQYFMEKIDVPCIVISSESMNHAWNMVQIEDEWYHVDVTWDDPLPDVSGRVLYDNFLRSDAGIKMAGSTGHTGWESPYTATSTKYDSIVWKNPLF